MDMVVNMKDLPEKFGKQVRTQRVDKKMSQEELAFKAGISAAHLGQIERAEKRPTLETIGRLAEALDISLSELFSFEVIAGIVREEDPVISKINAQLSVMSEDEQRDVLRIIRIFRRYSTKR